MAYIKCWKTWCSYHCSISGFVAIVCVPRNILLTLFTVTSLWRPFRIVRKLERMLSRDQFALKRTTFLKKPNMRTSLAKVHLSGCQTSVFSDILGY